MANHYSVTLSDESATILRGLKDNGWKISHAVDVAILMTAYDGWEMIVSEGTKKAIKRTVGIDE